MGGPQKKGSKKGKKLGNQTDLTGYKKRKASEGDKVQDEVRQLHEAYQFLMKKYRCVGNTQREYDINREAVKT